MKSLVFSLKNQQLPVLSHKKTVNSNIITVKLCEKCFVQTKIILIDVNALLYERGFIFIQTSLKF